MKYLIVILILELFSCKNNEVKLKGGDTVNIPAGQYTSMTIDGNNHVHGLKIFKVKGEQVCLDLVDSCNFKLPSFYKIKQNGCGKYVGVYYYTYSYFGTKGIDSSFIFRDKGNKVYTTLGSSDLYSLNQETQYDDICSLKKDIFKHIINLKTAEEDYNKQLEEERIKDSIYKQCHTYHDINN